MIQKIETHDSLPEFVPQGVNKPYKVKLQDRVFNYFYTSFSDSVAPEIMLTFNGNRFVLDTASMQHKIGEQEFKKLLAALDIKLTKDHNFVDFLDQVTKLIYSGNADFAMQLIDDVLHKYDFNKLTAPKFRSDLLCKLKSSQYIDGIKEMNGQSLKLPSECNKENGTAQ